MENWGTGANSTNEEINGNYEELIGTMSAGWLQMFKRGNVNLCSLRRWRICLWNESVVWGSQGEGQLLEIYNYKVCNLCQDN